MQPLTGMDALTWLLVLCLGLVPGVLLLALLILRDAVRVWRQMRIRDEQGRRFERRMRFAGRDAWHGEAEEDRKRKK